MPHAMKRPCASPGCGRLAEGRLCRDCQAKQPAQPGRPTAAQRGYGYRWQKASRGFLQAHPLCADPDGRHPDSVVAATVTDHRIPHKGDPGLFWDPNNWQPLCADCHNHKTLREGSFGRPLEPRKSL